MVLSLARPPRRPAVFWLTAAAAAESLSFCVELSRRISPAGDCSLAAPAAVRQQTGQQSASSRDCSCRGESPDLTLRYFSIGSIIYNFNFIY